MQPKIGITLDSEEIGGYSKWYPWYALRKNYIEAIEQLGAIPVLLPHYPSLAKNYFDMLDGFIITGGDFDIDPKFYGINQKHEKTTTKPGRTEFEYELAKLAITNKKPVLGICGGEQLINVIQGGSLIQHIPDITENSIHEQKNPRNEAAHKIEIKSGSLLHKITGQNSMLVNSTHHQSVEKTGKDINVSAISPDDKIIEAIELSTHPFCLGVQWHPEYFADPQGGDKKIFAAFVDSARA